MICFHPITLRAGAAMLLALLLQTLAAASTASLLILHTNDIHDHVRPGDGGIGGLVYVSGYIKQVRAERNDVLVLDAGDLAEKGDLVAHRTHSDLTYEAVRRIGYDGVTIGNHEYDAYLQPGLHHFEHVLGQKLISVNLVKPDRTPAFETSRIVEVNGIRIGLTGAIVPRKEKDGGLNFKDTGAALAREEKLLRGKGAQLVIAVCHEPANECAEWSKAAPGIDVWVAGHSHEAIDPRVVPDTGAIIVEAGCYARWVGRLELEVDRDTGKIVSHSGELVPMIHTKIPVDEEMLAWVTAKEKEIAPEASRFVFHNPVPVDGRSLACLAADGFRRDSGADVAFCHPNQVIRDVLPVGPIDYNAVFLTGGQRGEDCVFVDLTGAEISAYVNALYKIQEEPPQWSGFRVSRYPASDGLWRTDLVPGRTYRVLMPQIEWETRYLRLAETAREKGILKPLGERAISTTKAPVNYTDSLCGSIKRFLNSGGSLREVAQWIADKGTME